jgi:hypothetical protein
MRVLIQSTITFLYLMDRDTATQNPDEARDFKHASKALRFVKQKRLTNVQIVLKFPKTSDDVNLAILELLEREQRKALEKAQMPGKVSSDDAASFSSVLNENQFSTRDPFNKKGARFHERL